ncbi:hypothetical protein ACKFKG_10645 [Phormidesmis sp. 146-35]
MTFCRIQRVLQPRSLKFPSKTQTPRERIIATPGHLRKSPNHAEAPRLSEIAASDRSIEGLTRHH